MRGNVREGKGRRKALLGQIRSEGKELLKAERIKNQEGQRPQIRKRV